MKRVFLLLFDWYPIYRGVIFKCHMCLDNIYQYGIELLVFMLVVIIFLTPEYPKYEICNDLYT